MASSLPLAFYIENCKYKKTPVDLPQEFCNIGMILTCRKSAIISWRTVERDEQL